MTGSESILAQGRRQTIADSPIPVGQVEAEGGRLANCVRDLGRDSMKEDKKLRFPLAERRATGVRREF